MGVTKEYETGKIHRGALIKLFGLQAVDFKDENFTNVGSYTFEQL